MFDVCVCGCRFVSVSDLWEPLDNGTDSQVRWYFDPSFLLLFLDCIASTASDARCGLFLCMSWCSLICVSGWALQKLLNRDAVWRGRQTHLVPRNHVSEDVYMGTTWQIWLNDLCSATVRDVATITVVKAISLTPNNSLLVVTLILLMWCWCFCPTLRSTFSYLKCKKMQDLTKIFQRCYPKTFIAERNYPPPSQPNIFNALPPLHADWCFNDRSTSQLATMRQATLKRRAAMFLTSLPARPAASLISPTWSTFSTRPINPVTTNNESVWLNNSSICCVCGLGIVCGGVFVCVSLWLVTAAAASHYSPV